MTEELFDPRLLDEAAKYLCELSLYDYVKEAWPHIESAPFVDSWHIGAICFPGDTLVTTDRGQLTIRDIVDGRLGVKVLSWNHMTKTTEWRNVTAWMKSSGKSLVEIETECGYAISPTENHPVFVEGRGYIPASNVRVGYRVDVLPSLRCGSSQVKTEPSTVASSEVLQSELLCGTQATANEMLLRLREVSWEEVAVQEMWKMQWPDKQKGHEASLSALRKVSLPRSIRDGCDIPPTRSILQSQVLLGVLLRKEQSAIRRWPVGRELSIKIQDDQEAYFSAGQKLLLSLPERKLAGRNKEATTQFGSASYRLDEVELRREQSRDALQKMSRTTRLVGMAGGGSHRISLSTVTVSRKSVRIPANVYNIEVEGNNNYFANGILVHNCEHLQAVSRGEIKKLLINVPPGTSKSIMTSVMWPTWQWVTKPATRFFYASYDQQLSTRDSVKCRALIQGPWYHGLWYDRFKFVNDQNQKTYFENDHGGYRLATSVGGHGTGQHPDMIVCFSGESRILTDKGMKRLSQVWHERPRGSFVWTPSGWRRIERIIRRGVRGMRDIRTRSGLSLRVTPDHRLLTPDGLRTAESIQPGESVYVDATMRNVWPHVSYTQQDQAVLLQAMPNAWARFPDSPSVAPYRRRLNQQRRREYRHSVQELPPEDPCGNGALDADPIVSNTYCSPADVFDVTVTSGHLFVEGVAARQCDDPHNVKRAEAEVNRHNVIEWWDLTMTTRGVSRGSARVIIMQRLHARDLAGYLLEQGGYEHICLPMRYEPDRMKTTSLGFNDPRTIEGELLTPGQFNEPAVTEMERGLGTYGTAGQLQQRPAPKEGGLFRTAWFQLLPAAPEAMLQCVRWWDFAATENEGDFTCGSKVGKSADGRFVILDIERGQWSSAERDRVIKATAMRDGHGVHQWCEQEPGSSGKTVAENFVKMLDGYTARYQPTRGDKVRNSEPLAAQAEVGSIYVVADRDGHRWNKPLFEEFELFPYAENDDIVDSVGKAFNKVAAMSHAVIDSTVLRYFEQRSNILTRLHLEKSSRQRVVDEGQCQRLAVLKCGAGDVLKPRQTPWSVLQVWDYDPPVKDMFLRHAWRHRLQWGELVEHCRVAQNEWRFKKLLIIHDDVGAKLHATLRGMSELVSSTDHSTLELSVPLQELLRKERVMLPCDRSDWRAALEAEWLAWTGAADEECAHIIVASYAARYLSRRVVGWGGTVAGEVGKQTVPFKATRF